MKKNALIIFVKNVIPGHVKTRLAATLGNDVAMDIYQQLLKNLKNNIQSLDAGKIIFYSEFIEDDIWDYSIFKKNIQQGNDLGERMKNAFDVSLAAGYKKAVIIGSDCPGIDENILNEAFEKLTGFDVVIGPATDGGYYLLGMKKMYSFLFQDIEWSTDKVLQQTLSVCNRNHLTYFQLPELSDIDEEKDLTHFKELVMSKIKSS